MANQISKELESFKKNVEPNLSKMETTLSNLEEKLEIVITSEKKAQDTFTSSYNSENKQNVMSNFENIEKKCTQIKTSLSSDLKNIITESKNLVEKVSELEEINKKIEEKERIINSGKKDTDEERTKLLNEREQVDRLNSDFKSKNEAAIELLAKLKAMDSELQFVKDYPVNDDYTSKLDQLKGGRLETRNFKASNNTIVTYVVYIPDYGEPVEGLPINMYMHGSGMGANSAARLTDSGLGKFISDKTITPSGIVILPLAPSGRAYESKAFRDALAELPLSVADEFKADKDKISLSGHSYGAITGYRLIAEHPGEFSSIVPVSGSSKVTDSFKDVKVWAFHGTADNNSQNTSYAQAAAAMNQINSLGGSAVMHAYEGWGHGGNGKSNIILSTFTNEFDYNGEKINPLEWAFQQSRNA